MRAVITPSVMSTLAIAADLARAVLPRFDPLASADDLEAVGERGPRRPAEVDARPDR